MPTRLSGLKKRKLLEEVLLRDGPCCHWCGVETVPVPSGHDGRLLPEHRTLDHVRRQRDGGGHVLENLVIACNDCNNRDSTGPCGAGPITEGDLAALLA